MFALFDKKEKAYKCGDELVPRAEVLAKFPRLDTRVGHEIHNALAEAYSAEHDGAVPDASRLHAWYMGYMDEQEHKVPDWMCKLFCKSQ